MNAPSQPPSIDPPTQAPSIELLTRRLAECPAEFLLEPRTEQNPAGQVEVDAVVNDLLRAAGLVEAGSARRRGESEAEQFEPGLPDETAARYRGAGPTERNLLRLTLVASWLCADAAIRGLARPRPILAWLLGALPPLAALLPVERLLADADRREELVRSLLDALGVLPAGESAAQAADRLRALSSVERARVIEATRAQQVRARKLREELAAERARQAAARYSSE